MLPLLPALILLILQGPTNVERMALDGRLPAALDAIHRQMESAGTERTARSRADGMAMASLLAISSDPHLSQALVRLLAFGSVDAVDAGPSRATKRDFENADRAAPPPCPKDIGKPSEGFVLSQRTRDGPTVRA